MERHQLGPYAGGVAGMKPLCGILASGQEPQSTPVTYDEIGVDLTGVPIEAGLGHTTLEWVEPLPQSDYQFLLDLQGDAPGARLYARAQERHGASGIDFANYLVVAKRPTFERRDQLYCYGVQMELVAMEPA